MGTWSPMTGGWAHPTGTLALEGSVALQADTLWGERGVCLEKDFLKRKQEVEDFPGGERSGIHLPMQGTQDQPVVRKDPTCLGAAEPVPQVLQPTCPRTSALQPRSHCSEKPVPSNQGEPPLAAAEESPRAATRTQHSQK